MSAALTPEAAAARATASARAPDASSASLALVSPPTGLAPSNAGDGRSHPAPSSSSSAASFAPSSAPVSTTGGGKSASAMASSSGVSSAAGSSSSDGSSESAARRGCGRRGGGGTARRPRWGGVAAAGGGPLRGVGAVDGAGVRVDGGKGAERAAAAPGRLEGGDSTRIASRVLSERVWGRCTGASPNSIAFFASICARQACAAARLLIRIKHTLPPCPTPASPRQR